jgi:hypothetical protein
MDAETIAQIDAQLFKARWGLWHATADMNLEQVEAAMAVLDALLERRYALTQAPVAAAAEVVAPTRLTVAV